ncbi:MAG: LPS-assembly protein LptD [Burkholderiaceae bacterium]|nr:LPS-assembly protein LptD [Burkholderiaceae bacterium]
MYLRPPPTASLAARAPARPAVRPLAWLVALAWAGGSTLAHAQPAAESGDPQLQVPPLRPSTLMQEVYPEEVRSQQPVYVRGDALSGQPDINTVIEGNGELRRGDTMIRADRLEYKVPEDRVNAMGSVHINQAGNVYEGTQLDLEVDAFKGFFDNASYRFLVNSAYGKSSRVDFIDRDHAVVYDATYTTCQRGDEASWQPAWMLRAKTLHVDMAEEVGVAEGAALQFKGVTVLPVPRMSFPLSDKRKSGLLPPTMGIDKLSGFEYTQPYYWNLAPNRDMTLYPSVMTKRGVNLGAQFRYLEPTYSGEAYAAYMPGDRLRERDRWSYSLQHRGTLDSPIGGLGLNMNLNRVSDDNYWRDFPLAARSLRERLLPNDVNLSWARGDGVLTLRTLYWQTMQDVTAPIAPPYGMQPQLQWRYTPLDLPHGLDFGFVADTTRFKVNQPLAGMTYNNGQRSYMQAQLSRPFLSPGAFITPKIMLHASSYQVDNPMSNGSRNATRTLPTVSVDSGLVFERDTTLFGRKLLQTFEPRAFYTYTPYRDQSYLPLYDTARNDFNFASIYSENDYNGQDRIADNHLLTLGATTRLVDADTGAEKARFGIAQRVRFSDQKVILPGEVPATSRLSDVLLGAAINWTDTWSTEATTQYNRDLNRSVRTTFGARYSPSYYRTVNLAYRTQYDTVARTDASKLVDVGWQWPLNDLWGDKGRDLGAGRGQGGGRWYTVGRLNYSLKDRKLVDTVVGFEYDGCCWIGRVVLERLQSSITQSNTRLLFQIEFVGFSRLSLGSDPQRSLKQNVPRYQDLRDTVAPPSRFTNYD